MSAGFCFRYPASWTMLGEVFDGNGVVVAPEQKEDREQWDAITVALIAPASDGGGHGPTLNAMVDEAAKSMRAAGQEFETLQRRELTVNHGPAQALKARYREDTTARDWIEELVFIQGPDDEIYSVALKCAPEHFARLEPVMKQLLASWTASPVQAPAEEPPAAAPAAPPGTASPSQEQPR